RMKMELIAALLHQPKVLFLDEPTIGLDVVSQKTVRDFLRSYNARQKTTILLTSHYMTDIQELCQRVIIIDKGRIFFDGRLGEIIDRFSGFKILTLSWQTGASFPPLDFSRCGQLVENSPNRIQLKVKRDHVIAVCKELLDKVPVNDIDIRDVP